MVNYDVLYGYAYDGDGYYIGGAPLVFANTPENIASFIMTYADGRCVITDPMDEMVVSSMPGGFLDRFGPMYQEMCPSVMDVILPMQYGEKQPNEIEYIEWVDAEIEEG